jgi:hypothetical protein
MNDLTLDLTPERKLTTLQLVAEFAQYDEVMQRAVMLMMTADREELYISGKPVVAAIRTSNAAAINLMRGEFQMMANELKNILNAESNEVEELRIVPEVEGTTVKLSIDITKTSGDSSVTVLEM